MKLSCTIVLGLTIFHDVYLQQTVSLSPKPRAQQISDICCYIGKYRIGLIPHPFRCDFFNQCRPILEPDGHYRFHPLSLPCEQGLFYDFRECKCLRSQEVNCFDGRLSAHNRDFFNCTTEFYEDGIDNSCGSGGSS